MTYLVWVMAAGLFTGCVDKRFVITSEPPGALVLVNDQPIGATPVDYSFVYYGTYKITLVKDGFETKVIEQEVETPWYEYVPLDFVSENLWPASIQDVRRFHYCMEPLQAVNTDKLLQDAAILRQRGRTLPQSEGVTPEAQPAVSNKKKKWWKRRRLNAASGTRRSCD